MPPVPPVPRPHQTPRTSRVETLVALLDQRMQATEQTNTQMLAEFRGLREDLDKLWRETIQTYVPVQRCEALCGRRDQTLEQLGRDVREELAAMRDGMDERVRALESSASGVKGSLPMLSIVLSVLATLGTTAINLAVRTSHP
jgi:hypothetical protein